MDPKYDPINLILDTYDYTKWFKIENEESAGIPPCHHKKKMKKNWNELKESTGSKILTPGKLLTKLSVLLAQVKAGNNS